MALHPIDFKSLRAELRALNRGSLLIIAERSIELLPATQLSALLGDFVQLTAQPAEAGNAPVSLLDEVRAFYDAAMDGKYYEHVEIGGEGRPQQSRGTDAFIAEFDRLMRNCVRVSEEDIEPAVPDNFWRGVRDCFELLFALLRHIDEGNDDVLAFADDGSSLDVGVNWRVVLPAYFECLAETEATSPEEFARAVGQVIADFAEHDRARYMDAAYTAANDAQRIAMTSR